MVQFAEFMEVEIYFGNWTSSPNYVVMECTGYTSILGEFKCLNIWLKHAENKPFMVKMKTTKTVKQLITKLIPKADLCYLLEESVFISRSSVACSGTVASA